MKKLLAMLVASTFVTSVFAAEMASETVKASEPVVMAKTMKASKVAVKHAKHAKHAKKMKASKMMSASAAQ